MAIKTYYSNATPQNPQIYYLDSLGNVGQEFANGFLDGSGLLVPVSATAPLPVTVISGSGVAVTIADGADVAEGATTDAAVAPGAAGTTSAKLRTVTTQLASNLGSAAIATRLCYPTAAGSATLSKTKWPSTYTVTLPTVGSGVAGVTTLIESAAVVGGVFSPDPNWGGVLLDFAAVSSADQTMVVEIGRLTATACMPQVIASVSLKTITTSGTFTANFDPFTGAAQSSTTFRLFDLCTITTRSGLGELLQVEGGTEDNTPMQLWLDTTKGVFYYILITTLGVTGPITVCITPTP